MRMRLFCVYAPARTSLEPNMTWIMALNLKMTVPLRAFGTTLWHRVPQSKAFICRIGVSWIDWAAWGVKAPYNLQEFYYKQLVLQHVWTSRSTYWTADARPLLFFLAPS